MIYSIKHKLIAFLIANAGVKAVLGDPARVFPQYGKGPLVYPLALVTEIQTDLFYMNASRFTAPETTLQIDIIGKSDLEVEQGKIAVFSALEDHPSSFDGINIYSVEFMDQGDILSSDGIAQDLYGGFLQVKIKWEG